MPPLTRGGRLQIRWEFQRVSKGDRPSTRSTQLREESGLQRVFRHNLGAGNFYNVMCLDILISKCFFFYFIKIKNWKLNVQLIFKILTVRSITQTAWVTQKWSYMPVAHCVNVLSHWEKKFWKLICKELAIKGQRFYAPSKLACHPATVSQTSRRPETPGSQMKDFISPSRASTYVLSTSSQALEDASHVVDSITTH